jgi:hypothetical protein
MVGLMETRLGVAHMLLRGRVLVTLDNCTTNDSMIGLMETRLGATHMLLRGWVLHMRYCARAHS